MHQLSNSYFKYQVCQMKLRHFNAFLQLGLLFRKPQFVKYGRLKELKDCIVEAEW